LKKKPLGYKFRRQHPIKFYILDFYCDKKKLSIEINGGYHNNLEQKEKPIQEKDINAFLGNKLFFGLLIRKIILEEYRFNRQQSMLSQIDGELKN